MITISLAYTDTGSGIPLLCLHGGMGIDSTSLRVPGILGLTSGGIRVIIPDQRGHGRSHHGPESEYTNANWATDAYQLAHSLGLTRLALFGHSYGGFIALEYALRWPESLSHLILVATSAGPVSVSSARFNTDAEVRDHFMRLWPLFFSGEDKHWDLFQALRFSAEAYNAAFTRELPRYDVRARIPEVTVPALLIVGSADHYLGPMEWLAGQMKNATLCVMKGVGHFPFVEAAAEFQKRVTDFILGGTGEAA